MPVVISDVLDPNTGDFDGVTIKIDYDQELDLAYCICSDIACNGT